MEIKLEKDSDIKKFSKHFLINGWGLKEQNKVKHIQVDFPKEWKLFPSFLEAMGNCRNISQPFALQCQILQDQCSPIDSGILMEGIVEEDLQVCLKNDGVTLRTWNFALPNSVLSTELIELSFFLSITEAIKSGLL